MSAGAAAASESARAREKARLLKEKAERLERRAEKFERGERGERRVAAGLDRLGPIGYARIDDVRWPGSARANVDHVVFGPAGCFVIDAKNWQGRVEVRDGVLRQNGYRRSRETDKVKSAAQAIQEALAPSVGRVNAVLCLVEQKDQKPVWCDSTLVVGVDQIGRWLFDQPAYWPDSHTLQVAAWAPSQLQPASGMGPVVVVGPSGSGRLP